MFEQEEKRILKEMIERRDTLNKAITQLEYEIAHPSPPINMEKVMEDVKKEMEWVKEHMPDLFKEKVLGVDY